MPGRTSILSSSADGHQFLRLVAFIVSDDVELTQELLSRVNAQPSVLVPRVLSTAILQDDLIRALRVYAPNVIFMDVSDLGRAGQAIRLIREQISGVQIVAVARTCDSETLLHVMRFGIQEFLSMPIAPEPVADCCERMRAQLAHAPSKVACTDLVFSFLPAKAGVGASTIAANCSTLAAEQTDGRVFLGDFDLNSGIIRFMLRVTAPYSIVDAVKRTADLDGEQWNQIAESRGNLDIVHAGNIDLDTRVDPSDVRRLLDFTRRAYKIVCADLSGNLEKFSLEIMRESKLIFLITTPELPALYLAREKVRLLETIDLSDRVAVVVNRFGKRQPMTVADIEGTVGAPVVMTLPNDYLHLHSALQRGTAVDRSSALGVQFSELTKRMIAAPGTKKAPPKRFLEQFAIVPMKYRMGSGS